MLIRLWRIKKKRQLIEWMKPRGGIRAAIYALKLKYEKTKKSNFFLGIAYFTELFFLKIFLNR